jgi:XTP/dITP diphosphohydrolase
VTARLVLATANPAKVREFHALLDGLGYTILSLEDVPAVVLPPEGPASYVENARQKARVTATATGLIALGDDSGIEVAALRGRPGPESARYGGPGLADPERVRRLLAEVGDAGDRRARFRCALALVAPWGEEADVEGTVEGRLAAAPRGTGGFGYDPIFLVPELGRTMAELPPHEKHRVSHRGRAAALARPILARWRGRAARETPESA